MNIKTKLVNFFIKNVEDEAEIDSAILDRKLDCEEIIRIIRIVCEKVIRIIDDDYNLMLKELENKNTETERKDILNLFMLQSRVLRKKIINEVKDK